jgi:hypothetical protein
MRSHGLLIYNPRKEITMSEKKTQIITINGTDYTEDQLTDEQKIIISHIADLDRKISSAKFNLDQLSVGREAFVNMLTKSLTDGAE